MCEIVAVSLAEKTEISKIDFLKKFFLSRGRSSKPPSSIENPNNPDGWGIAFYPDKSAFLIKEGFERGSKEIKDSELLKNLLTLTDLPQEMKSFEFIGHLREGIGSNNAYKNTHPFSAKFNGKEYIFCHNGVLYKPETLNISAEKLPLGETDSEKLFCHIITELSEHNKITHEIIHNILLKANIQSHKVEKNIVNNNTYALNCILSDGEYIYCYKDFKESRSLFFLENSDSIYVSTYPFLPPKEKWTSLNAGELLVLRQGKIIHRLFQ